MASFDTQTPPSIDVEHAIGRVVVLTQTCDLASQRAIQAVVAVVLDAESLVASGRLKIADILGDDRGLSTVTHRAARFAHGLVCR